MSQEQQAGQAAVRDAMSEQRAAIEALAAAMCSLPQVGSESESPGWLVSMMGQFVPKTVLGMSLNDTTLSSYVFIRQPTGCSHK